MGVGDPRAHAGHEASGDGGPVCATRRKMGDSVGVSPLGRPSGPTWASRSPGIWERWPTPLVRAKRDDPASTCSCGTAELAGRAPHTQGAFLSHCGARAGKRFVRLGSKMIASQSTATSRFNVLGSRMAGAPRSTGPYDLYRTVRAFCEGAGPRVALW